MLRGVIVLLASLGCAVAAAEPVVLRACVPERNAPPFTYQYLQDGRERSGGFAWRVLGEILPPAEWQLRIELLPWARCLRDIAEGKQDLTVNATWNAERETAFRLSRPYYLSHVHYFYSRERFAEPPVATVADLQRRQTCGVLGHNYAQVGLRPDQIDTGSRNFESVFRKILAGRCEVFAQSIEDIEGERAMGEGYLADPRIAHAPLAGVAPIRRCFLFSRANPALAGVVSSVDAGIERLVSTHAMERLLEEENTLLRQRFEAAKP